MSFRNLTVPVVAISCDRPGGCSNRFQRASWANEWGLRQDAAAAGWQVRPARGKGSRTDPDLCPTHRPPVPAGQP